MSTPKDLRDGAKAALVAASVTTANLIYLSKMPTTPDRVVVLTWYPVSIDHTEGLQARIRGTANSTTSAEDLASDVKDALHNLAGLTWGDTDLVSLTYQSGARMGFDANNRDEVVLNFYALTSAASTAVYHD